MKFNLRHCVSSFRRVSGTTVFAEHLVPHAVMTEEYALPAIPEDRVIPSPLAGLKE